MNTLSFSKMHGLGNDFMVLDLVTQHWAVEPERVAAWADRHTGVGFDQLLILAPPTTPEADFDYRIYNADGTEAEQCGNGARCIARFVQQRGLSPKAELKLNTNTGPISTRLRDADQVEVDLQAPNYELSAVPFAAEHATAIADGFRLTCAAGDFEVTPVSVGNPHGVIFVEQVADAPVAEAGPLLTTHAAFPAQANIGFCQVIDNSFLRLRVHERGVGETRACGSGACAAVAVAYRLGLVGDRVKVSLPGGKVRIAVEEDRLRLAGPASLVFNATIEL